MMKRLISITLAVLLLLSSFAASFAVYGEETEAADEYAAEYTQDESYVSEEVTEAIPAALEETPAAELPAAEPEPAPVPAPQIEETAAAAEPETFPQETEAAALPMAETEPAGEPEGLPQEPSETVSAPAFSEPEPSSQEAASQPDAVLQETAGTVAAETSVTETSADETDETDAAQQEKTAETKEPSSADEQATYKEIETSSESTPSMSWQNLEIRAEAMDLMGPYQQSRLWNWMQGSWQYLALRDMQVQPVTGEVRLQIAGMLPEGARAEAQVFEAAPDDLSAETAVLSFAITVYDQQGRIYVPADGSLSVTVHSERILEAVYNGCSFRVYTDQFHETIPYYSYDVSFTGDSVAFAAVKSSFSCLITKVDPYWQPAVQTEAAAEIIFFEEPETEEVSVTEETSEEPETKEPELLPQTEETSEREEADTSGGVVWEYELYLQNAEAVKEETGEEETAETEEETSEEETTEAESPEEETPALEEQVLYVSDSVYLTGTLPAEAVAQATPVDVDIDGQIVLAAYDIEIFENEEQQQDGNSWQPEADTVQVHIVEPEMEKISNDELSVYGLQDMGSEAQLSGTAQIEPQEVVVDAGESPIVVVTQAILEKTITASDGSHYRITVTYDTNSGFPADAQIRASEITFDEETYRAYMESTVQTLGESLSSVTYTKLFDISIVDQNGTEYQPDDTVQVMIELLDEEAGGVSNLHVVHFGDDSEAGGQELQAVTQGSSVSFQTEGFSMFSLTDFSLTSRIINAIFGSRKLYENDDIILTGQMPLFGIVEATPASVEIEDADVLMAYDIKIYANSILELLGIPWQPGDGQIQVTMKSDVLADGDTEYDIYHFASDSSAPEYVSAAYAQESAVVFDASSFSVYAVTQDSHFHTYKFYVPTNGAQTAFEEYHIYTEAEGYTTFTQIIKNAAEGLVVPQLPAVPQQSNSTFSGWYLDTGSGADIQNPTLSSTEFDFDHIPEVTSTEEFHLYARFANFAYVIFHEQYNGATSSWPITATRRGELVGDPVSTTIPISDVTVSYDDSNDAGGEDDNDTAPAMAFRGWTLSSGLNEEGTAARENAEVVSSPITISENTDLYPVFVHINWLTFVSGPSGSGATYFAPTFYYIDEGADSFTDYLPVRRGYTFDGWFTGRDASGNGTGVRLTDAQGRLTKNSDLSDVDGLSWEDGKLVLSKNVTIYAKWVEAASSYTIVIWRQKITDDVNASDAAKTYDFAESIIVNANTGSTASVANIYKQRSGDAYTGFYYRTCDANTTVNGNGTTILNVYYDRYKMVYQFNRRDYTYTATSSTTGEQYGTDDEITYYRIYNRNGAWRKNNNNNAAVYTGTRYTRGNSSNQWAANLKMTGLYGQKLADRGYTWPSAYYWRENYSGNRADGTGITFLSAFNVLDYPQESLNNTTHTYTVNLYSDSTAGNRNIIHVLQDLNGNYSLNNSNLVVETRGSNGTFNLTNKFEGFQVCGYSFNTFTSTPTYTAHAGESATSNTSSTLYVYHERNQYDLTFVDAYDNRVISTQKVYYEAPLSTYRPEETPTSSRVGYEFTNWFNDHGEDGKNGSVPFDFSSTMPMANVIVYACWETQWYLIKVDPNGGAFPLDSSYSTWFWKQYGTTELVTEYENTSRHFVESLNGTWYYAVKNRDFYGLSDEWDDIEDSISDRKAYYTQDISDPAIVDLGMRFKESQDAFRYASWYEVEFDENGNETGEHLYNFATQIDHDMTLRLHWKQVGTYYIRYDAGDGTLDDADNNEDTFKILDSSDYSDHSDVVITRTANPPDKYNFIGWTIRGGDGRVYYPGQAFEFQSKYAIMDGEKEVLILDAVYSRVGLAKIIYDANGGVIDTSAVDYGQPTDSTAPAPVTGCSDDGTQAVISNLINNSGIRLSSGSGFSMSGSELIGWNTEPDGSGDMFDLGGEYYVDTEDPVNLYAVWAVRVYFDKNNANADWGGSWDGYTWDETREQYYITVFVNQTITEPAYVPVSSQTDERFAYWSLVRYTDSSDVAVPFDFANTPVEGETTLYGFWADAIQVPYHAVDSSAQALTERTKWIIPPAYFQVNVGTEIPLQELDDTVSYVNVPNGYTYAFACVSDSLNNCSDAKDKVVTSISYNTVGKCVQVTYKNGVTADLPSGYEIYLVYYQDPLTLDIRYKVMDTDGSLSNPDRLMDGAPTAASSDDYNMTATVTQPRNYAYNDYAYYSYAIGNVNAANGSDLILITESSNSDSNRPNLRVKNTWRGFQYSLDRGNTWISCGYEIELYVIYYDRQPRIITIQEITYSGIEDIQNKTFHYTVEITNSINSDGEVPTIEFDLKDGESQSISTFYWETTTGFIWTTTTYHTQTIRVTQTEVANWETDNSSTTGTKLSEYSWTYTTTSTSESPVVTFTNTHKPVHFPVHVALITGGQFINKDSEYRNTNAEKYTLELADLDSSVNLTEGTLPELFTGNTDNYTFAGIVYGTEDENGVVTVAGTVAPERSVTYGNIRDHIYEMYLNDTKALTINEETLNHNYNIYFVYYEMPRIYYVTEAANGTLTQIDPIQRNGNTFSLNGVTVAQGNKLNVGTADFTISQSGTGNYRIPQDLDWNGKTLFLDYVKLAAGPSGAAYTSDLEAVTTDKVMTLKVVDSQVRYSMDGGNTWNVFSGEPAVYAIYKEKGYDFRITKKVIGTNNDKAGEYQIMISSPAITENSYAITGYMVNGEPVYEVAAVPASGTEPGTISLTVKDGSDITLSGIQQGTYIIKETLPDIMTLTAKVDGHNQAVTEQAFPVTISNANRHAELTNTRRSVPVKILKVDEKEEPLVGASFTLDSGTLASGTIAVDGSSTVFDGKLYYGCSYVLQENTAPENYQLLENDVKIEVTETGVVQTSEGCDEHVTVSEEPDATGKYMVTVKNEPSTASLSVTKQVTGDFGDLTRQFTFTMTVDNGKDSYSYKIYTTQVGSTWTEDTTAAGTLTGNHGTYEFTLAHDQRIVFEDLPLKTTISVSEEYGDYSMSVPESAPENMSEYEVLSGSDEKPTGVSFRLIDDAAFTVTNHLEAVAPTDYSTTVKPYLWLLLLGIVLAVPVLYRKWRKRGDADD